MNQIVGFIEKSKALTRNPLGIIALFISLIYGFACLVLSTSIKNFVTQNERLPLIWFIIVFPIIILLAFVYLVIFHHQKLYSPSDFKDETNFFKPFEKGQYIYHEEPIRDLSDESIDIFINSSSIIGLFVMYSVYLSYITKTSFKLEDLESHSNLLNQNYTHGFMVAASSMRIFAMAKVEEPFIIISYNQRLAQGIKERCYKIAETDMAKTNNDFLLNQIKAIENAFKVSQ